MNAYQKRVLQSFRRAQGWLAARPEVTTTGTTPTALGKHAAALDSVVASVTSLAAEQESQLRGRKGSTLEAKQLREELFTYHIRATAAMASVAIPDVVRMTETLRAPKATIDAEGLLAAADAMATASEQYADVLVETGLPADFVAQLRAATEEYRGAIDAGGNAKGGRRGATQGLKQALGRGSKAVLGITVLVKRLLRDDAQALAEWRQITRVEVKGVQPDASATTPPAAVEPATLAPAEQKAA